VSEIREYYKDYIMDLEHKIEVCDRLYIETKQVDWLDTYKLLQLEVEEIKTTVKQMERYNEANDNQSSKEKPLK
jgi:FtsZ-binding cell division protein ZapB